MKVYLCRRRGKINGNDNKQLSTKLTAINEYCKLRYLKYNDRVMNLKTKFNKVGDLQDPLRRKQNEILSILKRLQAFVSAPIGSWVRAVCTATPGARANPDAGNISDFCVYSFTLFSDRVAPWLFSCIHECSVLFRAFIFLVDYSRFAECFYSVTRHMMCWVYKWHSAPVHCEFILLVIRFFVRCFSTSRYVTPTSPTECFTEIPAPGVDHNSGADSNGSQPHR